MACDSSEYYIEHLGVIDSTNSYARENADALWEAAGKAGIVAVRADEQTAGRGQRGNVWQSGAGENLLVSLMVRPGFLAVSEQFVLSQAIALAVRAAVGFLGCDVQIKWPNDIYAGDRKLAGVLVELDCCGEYVSNAVIGVGLNVNQTIFEPMDKVPVSLKMLQGGELSIDEVLAALLDAFSYYYSLLERGEAHLIAEEYKKHLVGYKRVMRYSASGELFDARIKDVLPGGHLLLERTCGTLSQYTFKEVELLL